MKENKNGWKQLAIFGTVCMALLLLFNMLVIPMLKEAQIKETNYSFFLKKIDEGAVEKVQIENTVIKFETKNENGGKQVYSTVKIDDPELVSRLYEKGDIDFTGSIEEINPLAEFLVSWVLPLVFMIVLWNVLMKGMSKRMGGNSMSFGKSNAKIYVKAQTGKTFSDVAGQDEAKEALVEIVDFLHNPKKYAEIGANLPKGALLVGPPGTGKTLLGTGCCR